MKRSILIMVILIASSSFKSWSQTSNWYMCWDAGTSTKKVLVLGAYGGYEMNDERNVSEFVEIGLRAHITMHELGFSKSRPKQIKYGSVNAGLKLNINRLSIAPLIGFVIGGDQQKQDRFIQADSVVYLEHGATSANFITMLGSVRCGWKIGDDCDLYMQGVYCNKVMFLGLGINIKL